VSLNVARRCNFGDRIVRSGEAAFWSNEAVFWSDGVFFPSDERVVRSADRLDWIGDRVAQSDAFGAWSGDPMGARRVVCSLTLGDLATRASGL